jgi:hypothetical protein
MRSLILIFAIAAGCSDATATKQQAAADLRQSVDDVLPGGKALVTQLQKQIDWKKTHGITKEKASELCSAWLALEANQFKDVEDFWRHAVTVTPAQLEAELQ